MQYTILCYVYVCTSVNKMAQRMSRASTLPIQTQW
jgi:hypothetical protein